MDEYFHSPFTPLRTRGIVRPRNMSKKDFLLPLKSNRKVALSKEDQQQGRYVSVDSLPLEANITQEIWLEGVSFPLLLSKR